jgi:transcriptional regulator with XRE-family HTH domain
MAPTGPLDKAQSQPRTRGEARRALLRERGISLSDIARDLGKNLSVVSRVNGGQRRSREIEAAIARHLGLSVREAFPEWHGEEP